MSKFTSVNSERSRLRKQIYIISQTIECKCMARCMRVCVCMTVSADYYTVTILTNEWTSMCVLNLFSSPLAASQSYVNAYTFTV